MVMELSTENKRHLFFAGFVLGTILTFLCFNFMQLFAAKQQIQEIQIDQQKIINLENNISDIKQLLTKLAEKK